MLGIVAAVPVGLVLEGDLLQRAALVARRALALQAETGQAYAPKFFTAEEWRMLRVLVDLIIPRDARSGSATDAGCSEFIDFVMTDRPNAQEPMRRALAWFDAEARRRHRRGFADCTAAQQTGILDVIAWPDRAAPEMAEGVRYFNTVRDHTASAFWSSEMGVRDIGFMGNVAVPEWRGCPDDAVQKIGASYREWEG